MQERDYDIPAWLRGWHTLDEWLQKLERTLVVGGIFTILLFGVLHILMRNIAGRGLPFTDILAQHLTVWLGLLGATLAAASREHISIDAFSRALQGRSLKINKIVIGATATFATGVLTYRTWVFLLFNLRSQSLEQVHLSASVKLPLWVFLLFLHLVLLMGWLGTTRLVASSDWRSRKILLIAVSLLLTGALFFYCTWAFLKFNYSGKSLEYVHLGPTMKAPLWALVLVFPYSFGLITVRYLMQTLEHTLAPASSFHQEGFDPPSPGIPSDEHELPRVIATKLKEEEATDEAEEPSAKEAERTSPDEATDEESAPSTSSPKKGGDA